MALFSFRARKSSPSHAETKTCTTPGPTTRWASLKSRLSGRKATKPVKTDISANTGASIKIAPNQLNLHKNLPPIPSYPRPRSPPDLPNVAGQSLASLSLGMEPLGSRTTNPESSRLLSPDSRATPSLSEYNSISHAPPRANMLGAVRTARHQAPPSATEADERVCYTVRSSEHPAPISSSNRAASNAAVRFVEGKERSKKRDFGPTPALESFIASRPYAADELSACLSSGTAAKTRRPHVPSQQTQSTRLLPEPTNQSLAPSMGKTLYPTSFAENDVDTRMVESAARRVQPPSSAAPVYPTSRWHRELKEVAKLTPVPKPFSKGAHESTKISSALHGDDERNEPVRRDFPPKHRPARPQANQPPTSFYQPPNQPTLLARANGLGETALTEDRRTVVAESESARGEITCISPPAAPVRSKTVSNDRTSCPRPQDNRISIKVASTSVRAMVNKVNVADPGEDNCRTVDSKYASARREVRTSPPVAPIRDKTVSSDQRHSPWPQGGQIGNESTPSSARPTASKLGVTDTVEKNRLAVDITNESARGKVRFLPSDAPTRNKTVSTPRDPRPRFRDDQISAEVTQSSVPAAVKKPRATDLFESNHRAADARDDESAGSEPRPSLPAAPVGPTPPSHRKSSKVFKLHESSTTPSASPSVLQRPSNFKSGITSLSREDSKQPKSSTPRCPTEDEAPKGQQLLQTRDSNQRSGPYYIGQSLGDTERPTLEADLSGATPTNWLRPRCALHSKGSSRNVQAPQANVQSDKLLAWFDEPVPTPHLNLGNDGIASETTVFTSKGPLCVSWVEEQLRWWSRCTCSERYYDWLRFAVSAGYSIGDDFTLTPFRRQPPKTDKRTKLMTYFRKS